MLSACTDGDAETGTKRLLTEASLPFFVVVSPRRARSQTGLDGSYLGPRGTGRVEKIRVENLPAGQLAAGEQLLCTDFMSAVYHVKKHVFIE